MTILVTQMANLKPWLYCRSFKNRFHFSVHQTQLAIDDAIHNDVGLEFSLIRFFHNKLNYVFVDLINRILLFFSWDFLVLFYSIIGLLGFGLSLTYFQKLRLVVPVYLITIFLFEIIIDPKINFLIKLIYMNINIQFVSLFAWEKFLRKTNIKRVLLVVFLIWFSLWWSFVFVREVGESCVYI